MTTDLMAGYIPIEHFQETDDDHSTVRIRDMPYGKRRESLAIYPTELVFAATPVDQASPPYPIMVTNDGYDVVVISRIKIVGDYTVQGDIDTILPGEHASLQVVFTPQREGLITGGLYLDSGSAAGEEFITLSGIGGEGTGWSYDSRDDLVDRIEEGLSIPEGQIITIEGQSYISSPGATTIPDMPGFLPHGQATGEHYGAKGDGTTDDSAAFIAALSGSIRVQGIPGKYYLLGDVPVSATSGILDLSGSVIYRTPGAQNAVWVKGYHTQLVGGDFVGQYVWHSTTASGSTVAGSLTMNVTDGSVFKADMSICYASSWRGMIEPNEIASIAGNKLTLKHAVRGTVTNGTKVHGDWAMVKLAGPNLNSGSIRNIWIRQCLFGLQVGENIVMGGNKFCTITNVKMLGCPGAGMLLYGNNAAQMITDCAITGGYTQTAPTITAQGGQRRFPYPYAYRTYPSRWGSSHTVSITINGTTKAHTEYTLDLATGEIVLNTPCVGGETIIITNYEFSPFGIWANSENRIGPSSLEHLNGCILIGNNIGMYLESVTLGQFTAMTVDGSSYAAVICDDAHDMHFTGGFYSYTPYSFIIEEDSDQISISGGFVTTPRPDSAEFIPTVGKTEIVVEPGATDILIDFLSWHTNTFTHSIDQGSIPDDRLVALGPTGLGIGMPLETNRLILKGSDDGYLQIPTSAKQIIFGGTGYHYISAQEPNSTLRLGTSVVAGTKLEIATPGGVVYFEPDGKVGINDSTPSAMLDVAGSLSINPGASVTPADNGDVTFQLTSNNSITIKAKGSDGVIRSVNLTLA